MQRVMIVGGPGSGKSTLARQLGTRTGLPVFHMDRIHWQPGWVERPQAEKQKLIEEIVARDAWILDGNHTATLDARLRRADTLIWLDLPAWYRTYRVVRRAAINRGASRPDLPENCPERFDREFLEFIAYIWRTRRATRRRHQTTIATPPPNLAAVHRLASPAAIDRFVAGIPPPATNDRH